MTKRSEWTMLDLVERASPDILPPGKLRHFLWVLAKHADPNGETFVGVATIAIGMGYRMNDDGSLSESARKAFWRLDAEAQTQRLITHGPCTCDTAEHDFHFRVATTLIAAHQVAKRRQISSPNGD